MSVFRHPGEQRGASDATDLDLELLDKGETQLVDRNVFLARGTDEAMSGLQCVAVPCMRDAEQELQIGVVPLGLDGCTSDVNRPEGLRGDQCREDDAGPRVQAVPGCRGVLVSSDLEYVVEASVVKGVVERGKPALATGK